MMFLGHYWESIGPQLEMQTQIFSVFRLIGTPSVITTIFQTAGESNFQFC
jgi:hypothetical protein